MPRIAILSVFALGVLFSIGLQTQALDTFEAEKIEAEVAESNTAEEVVALEVNDGFDTEISLGKKGSNGTSDDDSDDELLETTSDPIVVVIEDEEETTNSRRGGGGSRDTSSNDEAVEEDDETPAVEPGPGENPSEEPVSPATPSNPADLNGDGLVNDIDLNILTKIAYGDCVWGNASGPIESCFGDVNLDGKIDFDDLTHLLAAWYDPKPVSPADLNRDGSVGYQDIDMLIKLWGTCTTPDYLLLEGSAPRSNVCWGDVDGDGDVDFDDLTQLIANWTEEK